MQIDPNFPCADCEHKAYLHFVSVVDIGNPICLSCFNEAWDSNNPNRESKKQSFMHLFRSDNLSYLEAKANAK